MEQEALNQAIYAAVSPLENRIAELCQIIRVLTEQLQSVNTDGPTYVIDTETTELDPIRNELLQVSVLDLDGQVIYNSHFMPCAESWPEAESVNHITPEMVKDAPSISQEITGLSEILSKASTIIGYNTSFDLDFLRFNGLVISQNVEIVDVMDLFAPIYGEWDEKHEDYRWKSLSICAEYYGYDWSKHPGQAHNSLADCRATLLPNND